MSEITPGNQEPVLRFEKIWEDVYVSLAYIALRGENLPIINRGSTTRYEVLSGSGTMIVGGVRHHLQEGVVVEVPKDTPYQDFGSVDMLAFSVPPFDITTVVILNETTFQ